MRFPNFRTDILAKIFPEHEGWKHYEKAKSETTTWLTPLSVVQALGKFDCDPCGYPGHGTAEHLIHPPADGLKEHWHGRVWLNPPYGRGIDAWLFRLWGHGNGIALVPARTETEWFQTAVSRCAAVCFLKKRIAFLTPEGISVTGNTIGSALVAYGGDNAGILLQCDLDGIKIDLGN
jgi:hypothetical protein